MHGLPHRARGLLQAAVSSAHAQDAMYCSPSCLQIRTHEIQEQAAGTYRREPYARVTANSGSRIVACTSLPTLATSRARRKRATRSLSASEYCSRHLEPSVAVLVCIAMIAGALSSSRSLALGRYPSQDATAVCSFSSRWELEGMDLFPRALSARVHTSRRNNKLKRSRAL